MSKIILVLILMLGFIGSVTAQQTPTRSIYAELYGAGLTYSVNYDVRFDKNDINSWGMRVGVGAWRTGGTEYSDTFISIPAQLNKLIGNNRHFFEYGGGATLIYFRGRSTSANSEFVNKNYNFFLDFNNTPSLMGNLNAGYRYIPKDNGITFRANLSPFFNDTGIWLLFGGISVGYAF